MVPYRSPSGHEPGDLPVVVWCVDGWSCFMFRSAAPATLRLCSLQRRSPPFYPYDGTSCSLFSAMSRCFRTLKKELLLHRAPRMLCSPLVEVSPSACQKVILPGLHYRPRMPRLEALYVAHVEVDGLACSSATRPCKGAGPGRLPGSGPSSATFSACQPPAPSPSPRPELARPDGEDCHDLPGRPTTSGPLPC